MVERRTVVQNSELDWAGKDSVDGELNEEAATATERRSSGIQASAQPVQHGLSEDVHDKDAFDELLDQLEAQKASQGSRGQQTSSGKNVGTPYDQQAAPRVAGSTASPGLDLVGSMPDVSMEELDAMLPATNDQGHTAEEVDEYEAFLRVRLFSSKKAR